MSRNVTTTASFRGPKRVIVKQEMERNHSGSGLLVRHDGYAVQREIGSPAPVSPAPTLPGLDKLRELELLLKFEQKDTDI